MDIKEIIRKAGGARAVAELTGVTTQAVYQWREVPAPHVVDIAARLGLEPRDLRPDVFREPAA